MQANPRFFQISLRTMLEATAVIAVGLALLSLRGCDHGSRYHLLRMDIYGVVLYDSKTGESWRQQGGNWVPLFGPAPPELKK